jgi:SOS-response transcriptional repressor LexA
MFVTRNTLRKSLTPAQIRFCRAVQVFWEREGHAPSFRDMCNELGFRSVRTAAWLAQKAREKGYLAWRPGRGRPSMHVTELFFQNYAGAMRYGVYDPKRAARQEKADL